MAKVGVASIGELPAHNHQIVMPPRLFNERDITQTSIICIHDNQSTNRMTYSTTPAGDGQPHNNMPPYLAVYLFKRTA